MNTKKIIILLAAAIVCAAAFYFGYWTKTPTYSMGLIREAAASHDVVKFQKHVNVKNLLGEAFDSLIIAREEITGEQIRNNRFAMGIILMMKPAVVDELEKELLSGIEGKEKASSEKDLGIANGAIDNIQNANMEIKGMSVKDNQNGIAHVDLKVYVPAVEKEMTMTVKMSELADGTWRAEAITNLADFFVEIEKAKIEKEYKKAKDVLKGTWDATETDPYFDEEKKYSINITEDNIKLLEKPFGEWEKKDMAFDPDKYESHCLIQFTDNQELGTSKYVCAVSKDGGKYHMTLIAHGSNGNILQYVEAVKR